MKERRVEKWAEFEKEALDKIQRMQERQAKKRHYIPPVLFRGQCDFKWELTTTLQRTTGKKEEPYAAHHRLLKIVHGDIQSFPGRDWNVEKPLPLGPFDVKGIEFMVYLRQNGFPSPLLDWTRSPYIAAYFAFRDVYKAPKPPECVGIYAFESLEDSEVELEELDVPFIRSIGPCLVTDKKHHLQQCQYTVCTRGDDDDFRFVEYPDEIVRSDWGPCVIEKYIIPIEEQKEVLRRLQLMNVTAFSLFGTEVGLIESLAVRELFLEKHD